jgi:hypothetical protein
LYAAQTFKYYSVDHARAKTEARVIWTGPRKWFLHLNPSAEWREREPGCEPALSLSAFRQVGRVQAIRFNAGGTWPEFPHAHDTRYYLECTQRWRLGREWLLGELSTGVGFPERESFRPDPFVGVMLEVILGNGK